METEEGPVGLLVGVGVFLALAVVGIGIKSTRNAPVRAPAPATVVT
jgi:hypothetical protein